MKQSDAALAPDFVTSLLVGVLATVLLLILSATNALAQGAATTTAATTTAATTTAATTPTASAPGTADVSPTAPGTLRMTWPRATRALLRGEVVGAADFVLDDTVVTWPWKQPPTDTATAITGFLTRRPFAKGDFMHGPAVAASKVIELGSTVKVLYQDGNVHLTLVGIATNSAALGAPIGVRLDKNRRVDGIAVGPNTVRLR